MARFFIGEFGMTKVLLDVTEVGVPELEAIGVMLAGSGGCGAGGSCKPAESDGPPKSDC